MGLETVVEVVGPRRGREGPNLYTTHWTPVRGRERPESEGESRGVRYLKGHFPVRDLKDDYRTTPPVHLLPGTLFGSVPESSPVSPPSPRSQNPVRRSPDPGDGDWRSLRTPSGTEGY